MVLNCRAVKTLLAPACPPVRQDNNIKHARFQDIIHAVVYFSPFTSYSLGFINVRGAGAAFAFGGGARRFVVGLGFDDDTVLAFLALFDSASSSAISSSSISPAFSRFSSRSNCCFPADADADFYMSVPLRINIAGGKSIKLVKIMLEFNWLFIYLDILVELLERHTTHA